ncbi:MAG: transferase spermidine synthase [Herminiimonas sp.]|nr:transferase spermidine synthase [Herminiimonas sp.]
MSQALKRVLDVVARDSYFGEVVLSESCLQWLEELAEEYPLLPARDLVELALLREHRDQASVEWHSDDLSSFAQILRRADGKPFAFAGSHFRSLHMDAQSIQSAMWLDRPDRLALPYTAMMMGFLLFQPAPCEIMMVGLGGGSLAKYCHRRLPAANITVLEIDADVVALRTDFLVPPDDHRFRICCIDAIEFIRSSPFAVDVVLLDGFDADGMVEGLNSETFFRDCAAMINPGGVLVANLWGSAADNGLALKQLQTIFSGIWWHTAIDSRNLIVFCVRGDVHLHSTRLLKSRASELDRDGELRLVALAAHIQTMA